jgi:hypothetical protein
MVKKWEFRLSETSLDIPSFVPVSEPACVPDLLLEDECV